MKIHLRFDESNDVHAVATVFINGGNSGSIVASPAEMIWLHHILQSGCEHLSPKDRKPIEFRASGVVPPTTLKEIDECVSGNQKAQTRSRHKRAKCRFWHLSRRV